MSQSARTIAGIVFLLTTFLVISLVHINPPARTPARSTESPQAGVTEGIVQGMAITQGFTSIKDYLTGIDLIFTHAGRKNTNENTLVLLGPDDRILHQQSFFSSDANDAALTPFRFDRPIFVGKGTPLRLSLYSANGSMGNSIGLLFNRADSIGPLIVSELKNNDVIASIKERKHRYVGSLMFRTYETDSGQFWVLKYLLYFLSALIAALIIWFVQLRNWMARTRIIPEWIYLAVALPAAFVFAVITPPLQVPDEGRHFLRSYEVADFHLIGVKKTAPVSIQKLDSSFNHLHFLAGEKTSMAEITRHFKDRLAPKKTSATNPPEGTLTYIPQAIGILIGKIFNSSPLTLMYLGRLFNLLISISIMFFAIRLVPQFKWIFLLLALMPKTIFLFGSLSYDSLTISLSFLTIAVFLYYAFSCERDLNLKDIGIMALMALLMLFCKPPSILLVLLFFFIPPRKFGKLYKYILITAGVAVLLVLIFKVGPMIMGRLSSPTLPAAAATGEPQQVIRPNDQVRHILNDIPGFIGVIVKSGFDYYRTYILNSFVGMLGWIDVELPGSLTNTYLLLLLLTALSLYSEQVRINIPKKIWLFLIMAGSFIIVEAAMYIFSTRPGRDRVYGVQGRYFIPIAPVVFMFFYNRYINPALNLLFSLRRKEYNTAKAKGKPAILTEITTREQLYDKSLFLFITLFCSLALFYSVYVTLTRYYNI